LVKVQLEHIVHVDAVVHVITESIIIGVWAYLQLHVIGPAEVSHTIGAWVIALVVDTLCAVAVLNHPTVGIRPAELPTHRRRSAFVLGDVGWQAPSTFRVVCVLTDRIAAAQISTWAHCYFDQGYRLEFLHSGITQTLSRHFEQLAVVSLTHHSSLMQYSPQVGGGRHFVSLNEIGVQ